MFARIELASNNYKSISNWQYIRNPNIQQLNEIYYKYCKHKKFVSVMPIFDIQYTDINSDIIGYYDNDKLVAFSLVYKYDSENVEAKQFAWDYNNPKLRLGIKSLENECAVYKALGFKFLYLGEAAEYKSKIKGYEMLGSIK